jgi:hypothetical protein
MSHEAIAERLGLTRGVAGFERCVRLGRDGRACLMTKRSHETVPSSWKTAPAPSGSASRRHGQRVQIQPSEPGTA